MSDTFISIIPKNVDKTKAQELADKVVNRLTEKGIIRRELTDCTLGDRGHAPGVNFKTALQGDDYGLKDLHINGLEIKTTREVFHNGGNGLEEINCPDCNTNIIDTEWGQAIDEWANETGNHQLTCPNCKAVHSITDYNFEPIWGFGELGFTFWNWPNLKNDFINEIEIMLERPVKVVYGRL